MHTQYKSINFKDLPKSMRSVILKFMTDRGYKMLSVHNLSFFIYTYKHTPINTYNIDAFIDHLDNPLFTISVMDNTGTLHANYPPYSIYKFMLK